MMLLIVGLIVLIGIHLVPTSPEVRDGLRNRMGPGTYRAVFSIVCLVGLVVVIFGYYKMQLNPGKNPVIWNPPEWTRHIALLLMLPAMIFLIASKVPSRIRNAVKHPMLAALKLWALAHLLVNGDVASLLLFGSALAYGVYDRISVKKRGALGPLGESQPSSPMNDVIVVGVGVALYAILIYGGHEWLIGVPPIPSISP